MMMSKRSYTAGRKVRELPQRLGAEGSSDPVGGIGCLGVALRGANTAPHGEETRS